MGLAFFYRKAGLFSEFLEFDKDHNGYVSLQEAYEVLNRRCGFPMEKCLNIFKLCDTNHDGQLSYEEFINFYLNVQKG